jgi:signal transduction histidine kinase
VVEQDDLIRDPVRSRSGSNSAGAGPADGTPAGNAAAVAGSIRTAVNLVTAPLTDALDDPDNPLAPVQHERVDLARRSATALVSLVEGLLDGSAPQGPPDASYAPSDLGAATREVASMFRAAAALAGVALTVEIEPLQKPVHVDRRMWEKLVVALLSRALRSGRPPVSVRLRETPDAALLEVISPALEDELGGIAVARQVAAAHGGRLDVVSLGQDRSTVRVAIPFGTSHLPQERIARPLPPAPRRGLPRPGERILVVADDPDLRLYLKRLVETRWTAEAAVDLPTALAAAGEKVPDLILIDADMRGGDGLALARALRVDPGTKRAPMIVIAAPGQEREGEAGPDEYVGKPFASSDLISRISAHLQLAHVREEATRREQKARLDAEAANRAKDEFIAMISHELRTPLGAILIWAQLLRAEELDVSATARAVGMIERSTKTLAQLIDDLLDVSRIIAGKLTYEARPVDLRYVVEAALDAAQPAAQSKGVTVERAIEPGVPPISGDASRLQQVVGNLLANAIKFTQEGGRIEAALERSEGRARVRVRDTGAGIKAEFLPYIFERFRQADSTSTRKQKGLGLGLAIARHIVEMHGGSIEAASAGEGHGSTFTVTLPLSLREDDGVAAGRPEGDDTKPAETTLAGMRILVVDDEDDAREAMAVLLGQAGAVVDSVGSVAEAMDLLRERPPDVLLSDIAMPGDDGYALIRQVRALAADRGGRVPAAALTAYATLEDRRKALLAGYNEHIAKPVDPTRLIATVVSLVQP